MTVTTNSTTPFTWTGAIFGWNDYDATATWDTANYYTRTLSLAEGFSTVDARSNNFTMAPLAEAFTVPDTIQPNRDLTGNDNISFAESFASVTLFNPTLAESFSVLEARSLDTGKPVPETFGFAETSRTTGYGYNLNEGFTTADAFSKVWTALLPLPETLAWGDARAVSFSKPVPESFGVRENWLRQGPVVFSEMVVRNDALAFSTFQSLASSGASGQYKAFQPFIPGDYDLQKALIKIVLTRDTLQQDVRLTSGKVYADMPDVIDSATVTITSAAAVTHVNYAKSFTVAPDPVATFISTAGSYQARISNPTKTGFDLELVDGSGTRHTGVVAWMAQGY